MGTKLNLSTSFIPKLMDKVKDLTVLLNKYLGVLFHLGKMIGISIVNKHNIHLIVLFIMVHKWNQ